MQNFDEAPRPFTIYVLAASFAAVSVVPLVLCDPLPLNDYAAHMARMYLLVNLDHAPDLQRFYEIHWHVLPNLAMDVIIPALSHVISLRWAGVAMVGLTLISLMAGAIWLHRLLFARISVIPLTAALILYNREMIWGLINFEFGVACALISMCLWLCTRNKTAWLRFLVVLVCGVTLFFIHLTALAIFGAMLMSYELYEAFRKGLPLRQTARDVMPCAIALIAAAALILLSPTKNQAWSIEYGQLTPRVTCLIHPFYQYNLRLDLLAMALVCGWTMLGLRKGVLRLDRHMAGALVFLLLAYIFLPVRLLSSAMANTRLIVPLAFLLCSAIGFVRPSRAFSIALLVIVCPLFLVRIGVMIRHWERANQVYLQQRRLYDRIPVGMRVAPLVALHRLHLLQDPPRLWLSSVLVEDRHDFVPIFAESGQQVLVAKAGQGPNSRLFQVDDGARKRLPESSYTVYDPKAFDYLLVVGRERFPPPPSWLTQVYADGDVAILKVDHERLPGK